MSLLQTRVKICGITRVEDALAASYAGADAIGLVFYEPSPRSVGVEQAKEIIASLPPFVTTVGLFVDADTTFVGSVLKRVSLDVLQFHGDENAEACRAHDKPYIKAIRMKEGTDLAAKMKAYPDTIGLLLDAYVPGKKGGTGEKFNWQAVPSQREKPIILAGGLNSYNVREAIEQVQPYAVDVSGGVESDKGVKDHVKIKAFIQEVNHAERK